MYLCNNQSSIGSAVFTVFRINFTYSFANFMIFIPVAVGTQNDSHGGNEDHSKSPVSSDKTLNYG